MSPRPAALAFFFDDFLVFQHHHLQIAEAILLATRNSDCSACAVSV